MEIPTLKIENAGVWRSPTEPVLSRPRLVLHYELECYLGEQGETWIDGVRFSLSRGAVLFARPGQLRFSRFPFYARFLYFDVTDPSAEFEVWLSSLPNYAPPSEGIEQALSTVALRLSEEDGASYAERQGCVLEALAALSRVGGKRVERASHPKQDEVFRSIRYMKENVYGARHVSDFASLAGYSVPHFNEIFRDFLGVTPYEYYLRLKMLEARRLLLSNRYNTTEIARMLGFGSASHFCAAFRKAFGISPLQFVRDFQHENALSDDM